MKTLTETQARHLAAFYVDVMGWSERGLMHVLAECRQDDPRAVALALARISLDPHLDGPGVLPQRGQHWRDVEKVTRPHRRLCPHSVTIENEAPTDATKSSNCRQCTPPPVLTTTREQREKQRRDAIQAAREAKRAERAEYEARQAEAREAEARKQAKRLTEARTEGDQP